MIQGAKYWNDKDRLYVQENNSFEVLLPGLEYCGPTAAVNCIAALYEDPFKGIVIQPEDYLTAFLLDPHNLEMWKKIAPMNYGFASGQTPPNRVRQLDPYAVERCFGVRAEYKMGGTFEKVASELWNGNAVKLCIPGHYIAAIAYDAEQRQIGFKDSWVNDRWPGGDTIPDVNNNKWFEKKHFEVISTNYVVYYKPEGGLS